MNDKPKIKVIKKNAANIDSPKRETAKTEKVSIVQTIETWITDFRQNKEIERRQSYKMLFG